MDLDELDTPCLLLDRARLKRNAERMLNRAKRLGVTLRPHLKTAKCIEVANLALGGEIGPVTVSTLHEAEYFAAHGYTDILYAVCITPDKLDRAARLATEGVALHLITDSPEVASEIQSHPGTHRVLIEVDCGEHRTGVPADSGALLEIAQILNAGAACQLMGVLTHAGHSYACRDVDAIQQVAEDERASAVHAARRLREADLPCPIVSVGSTPTAVHVRDLTGVTEMRPGVYLFGDLFQAGIGSCRLEDIASGVLGTVISHQRGQGRIVIDAGGLALSKDRSTRGASFDAGYGRLASPRDGSLIEGCHIESVHQEHGEVRVDDPSLFASLPVGARVLVLPNHICMTAAMYDRYHVLDENRVVSETWARTHGWHPYPR